MAEKMLSSIVEGCVFVLRRMELLIIGARATGIARFAIV
jgi:hypothetical protein